MTSHIVFDFEFLITRQMSFTNAFLHARSQPTVAADCHYFMEGETTARRWRIHLTLIASVINFSSELAISLIRIASN